MSNMSGKTFSREVNVIRENYDTSNPVISEILKAKEERLKILQELNKQHQEENKNLLLESNFVKEKKKFRTKKSRRSEPNFALVEVRRSTRLHNSPLRATELCKSEPSRNQIIRPELDYGEIPGVEIGMQWETRMECSWYGVHRPTVAGIHAGPDGAYSIALSGGYPEDVDEGYSFIYTGAGGRDLKGTATKPKNLRTAPQTKDQQLEGTNLSLVKSIESKLPVRVIRGYKSPSVFAPETGYRYDGLYRVVEYWEDVGQTGYRVYRFRMERIKDQPPPPWENPTPPNKKANLITETIDEFDLKENIPPDYDQNVGVSMDINPSPKDLDVDLEIQKCIDYFCRAAAIKDELKDDFAESDFCGWD